MGSTPGSSGRRSAVVAALFRHWQLGLVALVALCGLALERAGVLDWRLGLALAEGYAGKWWLAPALGLATAALFTAGLPGSALVWIVGILLPPEVGAPVFVVGGIVGALGAYALTRSAGGRRAPHPPGADENRLLALLAERSDFATLLAVRVAPCFPHSAINFAAGLLRVPVGRFLASTALGLALKGTLYVTAIHRAARLAVLEEAISWRTALPLALLTALLLAGPPLLRRYRSLRAPAAAPAEPA